ncbi:hypothetical protein G1H11_03620 [Phytoactinopolyspora alkaliphila]|uniref:Uncharacterized protein n=1 Tax=Phytoactinopolyspora alkaliphila TaxID=1783498 RepID=A0A6N9YHA6_9ACTN|nr:hypothetical protein [Phytoactinopolyspora alkaliphila]NED94396.1 hypothetical protein [Phytoactinopolyspora alkaliphila]
MTRMRFTAIKRCAAAAVAGAVLAACGGDDPGASAESGMGQAEGMLANLPSCDRVPLDEEPEIDADVPGLVLPDDARLTSVLEQGSLTTVDGTIRMTPLDLRADYESRTDLDVIRIEDEIFETEVLLRADGHRMYLRATALCADGTALSAVIGPDTEDTDLPEFQSDL